MNTIQIILAVMLILFVIYSVYDIYINKQYTKKAKVYLYYLLALLPVAGSFIYFIFIKHLLSHKG